MTPLFGIASSFGFFSIVSKGGNLHVLARSRRVPENLLALPGIPKAKIETWPAADHRWRIRFDPGAAAKVFGVLAGTVDYPNFKNEVARRPDQRAKMPAYHRLWGELFAIREEARPVTTRDLPGGGQGSPVSAPVASSCVWVTGAWEKRRKGRA